MSVRESVSVSVHNPRAGVARTPIGGECRFEHTPPKRVECIETIHTPQTGGGLPKWHAKMACQNGMPKWQVDLACQNGMPKWQ